MTSERAVREELVAISQRLAARGWTANHDGNVTARLGAGRILATPTATSKAAVGERNLIVVNDDGERVSGDGKPFGEIGLHLTVYKNRADVTAVVHAHPPAATGIACAGGRQLERPFIAEAVVSLGPTIPTVPFALPGAAACAALAGYVLPFDAVLLGNHGVIAWGVNLEQAYLRLELVEHLAKIALEAERAGGIKALPESALGPLLEARKKAGLLRPTAAAAATGPKPVVACAPSPTADVPLISPGGGSAATNDLAALIREEVIRSLRG